MIASRRPSTSPVASGSGDVARGSIVDAALTEAKDALFERGDTDATRFDALVQISERSLDGVTAARSDRYRTWIHLDADSTSAATTAGWPLPRSVRDRILCDGFVQPVWERDGVPFNVGRSQRIVPDRTRRVTERRDQGCRVPGRTSTRFVEIHHIVHWIDGGPTGTGKFGQLVRQAPPITPPGSVGDHRRRRPRRRHHLHRSPRPTDRSVWATVDPGPIPTEAAGHVRPSHRRTDGLRRLHRLDPPRRPPSQTKPPPQLTRGGSRPRTEPRDPVPPTGDS